MINPPKPAWYSTVPFGRIQHCDRTRFCEICVVMSFFWRMGGFVDSQKLTEVTFGRRHRAELCRTPETAFIFHFVLQCYPLIQCRSAAPPMPHWTAVHRPPEGASPGVREVSHNHCLTVDVCTELRIVKRTDLCEFGDAWSQS